MYCTQHCIHYTARFTIYNEGDLVRGHQCEMSGGSTMREGERESVQKARAAAEKSWTATVKDEPENSHSNAGEMMGRQQ